MILAHRRSPFGDLHASHLQVRQRLGHMNGIELFHDLQLCLKEGVAA